MRKRTKNRPGCGVLEEVKRSGGLCVAELAERMGLSYMGAKAKCLALEKSGHLTSRSAHKGSGRPQMVYRLTKRGQQGFSTGSHRLALGILAAAQTLYGPSAPEKLLFINFQNQLKECMEKLSAGGSGDRDRLAALAEIREAAGCMARVEGDVLVEAHSPLKEVFEVFPQAAEMEEDLIGKALGRKVRRRVEAVGEHYQIRFEPASDYSCRQNPVER